MATAITFYDYTQAKEYADEVHRQGFMPDIIRKGKGTWIVKVLGTKKEVTKELHGLNKIEEKEQPETAEVLGIRTGRALAKVPVTATRFATGITTQAAKHIRPKFHRAIPTTVGKHPNIDLDMPYTIGKGRVEPMPGSIGKGWGHKGVGGSGIKTKDITKQGGEVI